MHINEIYHTNELDEDSTSKKLLPVQKEGNKGNLISSGVYPKRPLIFKGVK